MDFEFFNHYTQQATGWWDRRTFLRRWWRLQALDRRWVPPYFPALQHTVLRQADPVFNRAEPRLLHMEALPRRRRAKPDSTGGIGMDGVLLEEPVATAALLALPRGDAVALGLFHCINHDETFERFYGELLEQVWEMGQAHLIGPIGVSPYLPSGLLQNYFQLSPPLHTPYNPPYLPELLAGLLTPLHTTQLYHLAVPHVATAEGINEQGLDLIPLDPVRLTTDLLLLFAEAVQPADLWPVPSAEDVQFVLHWLRVGPLWGWIAQRDNQPVGFVLLQPDLANQLRRAGGGRNPAWRLWFDWRRQQPTRSGRLLYGAVLPEWRNQGIGGQLWRQALRTAQAMGWQQLTVGPVLVDSPAAAFLRKQGATPQQEYVLYSSAGE